MIGSLKLRRNRQHHGRLAGRQALINAAIFIIVLFVFGSQLDSLTASMRVLSQADWLIGVLALAAILVTFPVAALSYRVLAGVAVPFLPVLKVQIASGFVNRLLPAGLGSFGIFVAYFRKQGLTAATATAIVGVNNILGFVGNVLLAITILFFRPQYLDNLHAPNPKTLLLVVLGIISVVALFGLVVWRSRWQDRVRTALRATLLALRSALRPDRRTALGLVYNIMLTSLNAAALSLSVVAVGGNLAWTAAVLVLSAATLLGAAIPTPGGIGGVEAGLLGGLLTFGVSPAMGLAAVLLYRGVTYWLPILPGIIMFRHVERRYL